MAKGLGVMRTFDRLSSTAALPWLRQRADRLRRAFQARRPAVRWGLVLAVVLGLAGAGYWTALALVPVGTRYLDSERPLAKDDLIKAERALKAQGIDCRIEDRKIVVAAEQYGEAAAVWAKLDLGPRLFDEIRQPPQPWSSWVDTLEVRERKERLSQERMLEGFLNDLDGVISSVVSIHWPSAKASRGRSKPSVFVSVETEADHRLPARTIDAITTILTSNLPELSPEAITVMDRYSGLPYYDPRNPAASDLSRKGARAEEIRAAILSKIAWIKGVQVWVDLLDHPEATPTPATAPAAAPAPAPAPPAPAERPEPPKADRSPALSVNQPVVLEEPERPPTQPIPLPAPAAPAAPAPAERVERGRILVNVPRSSYFNMIWTGADHREPTLEELHAAAVRTKEHVVKAVRLVVPESWPVEVDTIADDLPMGRPVALPPASDTRRKVMDWGIVAAITAAAVAVVAALGSWIQVARRPTRHPEPAPPSRSCRADSGAESNPSERVRELVRRDPEAAASVLQRWAAQGGPIS